MHLETPCNRLTKRGDSDGESQREGERVEWERERE